MHFYLQLTYYFAFAMFSIFYGAPSAIAIGIALFTFSHITGDLMYSSIVKQFTFFKIVRVPKFEDIDSIATRLLEGAAAKCGKARDQILTCKSELIELIRIETSDVDINN